MRKLKLDQLCVESFETAKEGAERGTVHGHVVTSSRTGPDSFGCFGSRGGILVQLDFRQPVEIEQIQAAVSAAGHDWRIKLFGPKNNYLIRIEGFEEPSGRPVHSRCGRRSRRASSPRSTGWCAPRRWAPRGASAVEDRESHVP